MEKINTQAAGIFPVFKKEQEHTIDQENIKKKKRSASPSFDGKQESSKKAKQDPDTFSKDFLQKANTFFEKSLPMVYAVEKPEESSSPSRAILGKDLLKNMNEWMSLTHKDIKKTINEHKINSLDFFIKKGKEERPQHIGSASSFIKNKSNNSFLVYKLLSFDEDKTDLSAGNLVSVAAFFFSGTVVREDKDYAWSLIGKVKDKTLLQSTLSNLLVLSCMEEKNAPITKALLGLGANPNRTDDSNELAIVRALESDNQIAAELLLKSGSSVTGASSSAGESLWDYLNEDGSHYDANDKFYVLALQKREEELLDSAHRTKVEDSILS